MRTATVPKTSILPLLVLLPVLFPGCAGDGSEQFAEGISSRSYPGHRNDRDADNLVAAYPSLVGTRLDDCRTCHAGGSDALGPAASACDRCHDLVLHGTGNTFGETLNAFGVEYRDAGRSERALEAIGHRDADGDGYSNEEELRGLRFPGSKLSLPGQAEATFLTVGLDELKAMRPHTQLMLVNTTRQRFDDYATFTGVTARDLFDATNVNLAGATGITVFAKDGYRKSLPIEYVDRVFPPPTLYTGLDEETLGPDCGFVIYSESMPDGLSDGSPLPGDHRLMLGYERNGLPLDADRKSLRLVVPQENPGPPDRGSGVSPTECNDGFDFDENADHNAGSMVRDVVAIRIDPMPVGVEDFDTGNLSSLQIDAGELILYGHGLP